MAPQQTIAQSKLSVLLSLAANLHLSRAISIYDADDVAHDLVEIKVLGRIDA